jgi:ribonuclease G
LPWFRWWKRRTEQAPGEAAPPEPTDVVVETPAQAGEDKPTRKRRRGTRGGKGRTRQADRGAETRAREPDGGPDRKPEGKRERQRRRVQPPRRALPAATRELLVSVDVAERRVAVLEDGRVAEVYLERPDRRSIAGNIYKGTVENVLPGMEAAFVEIGLEKNGFLYVDEIVSPELEGRRHGRKIQDLLRKDQELLVQAVKDPMKGKGARLTTEISLPGRFLVYVPSGEGLGVSRRLDDAERARLRDILKGLDPAPRGGIIVRTAADGASAEDIEADLLFLERLWKAIQARSKEIPPPGLVYQEAELPLRVVRDLFTEDFERVLVDHERTYRRIVGYLKKTSPHMVERVHHYKEKPALMDAYGVDAEIQSTLSARVDLPSGGYLVFDYAEAFTVIDVNTGRFTGSRSKSTSQRLEDTITKNNLEAVKEVVRQLRLRDIGGIIVIDFIDMANPKNRALVEEALRTELERDRTKTYVVEISPLGLVEMTRQNVTEGPREILTDKCPSCGGDGIVVSAETAAVALERRLRGLAAHARAQAFRVEVNDHVARLLVGPDGARLAAIEERSRRRFLLEPRADVPHDHLVVLAQGKRADLIPEAPFSGGDELDLRLVEIALLDANSAVGKVDGFDVTVAGAAKLVGKKVRARVGRVVSRDAFATLVTPAPKPVPHPPITAESQAEKPTRRPRKSPVEAETPAGGVVPADAEEPEPDAVKSPADAGEGELEKPKRKTRRGTRGGRGRKRKAASVEPAAEADGAHADEADAPRIHVPALDLGRRPDVTPSPDGTAGDSEAGDNAGERARPVQPDAAVGGDGDGVGVPGTSDETPGPEEKPKKKTRRGSRGGRRRRKTPAASDEASEVGSLH